MPLGWRKARPSKVTPRANARSESGPDRRRGVAAGGYWSRLGRGLLISLRVVATVTVLVGGCSGLFVLARELGPLTREWFLVRSVSVNGLHHVTRKEVIERLKALGALSVRRMPGVEEDTEFPLPKGLGDKSMAAHAEQVAQTSEPAVDRS